MSAPLLAVADARHMIVSRLKTVDIESVELNGALGRVLAEDAVARVTHPPANVSAMDGYAIRLADLTTSPTTLKVVGESAAGRPWDGDLKAGECVRIFTGAYVPAAADAVIIQENTTTGNGTVSINDSASPGKNIRPQAQDFRAGETLLRAPHRLTARDIGLLAAMNLPDIMVFRRPRIGVLSTGDEIALPGAPLSEGQIVSANGPGLCAFVESHGGQAINLGVVPDDLSALRGAISRTGSLDLLVTTGGVSVGEHDLVKRAAGEEGLQIHFHKIAMRPGKPLLFGQIQGMPFLGLPGNPVSAMVCATLFLGPALAVLQGLPGNPPDTITARLETSLKANDDREDYIRAVLRRSENDLPIVSPLPKQDSALVAALAQANGLIIRPPHAHASNPGETVLVIPLN